jgi:catechol 2,3-dioxygenase-like lactoylglutathione lyase family enzyme
VKIALLPSKYALAVTLAAGCFLALRVPAGLAKPRSSGARPPIVGIANIELRTVDMENARDFFGRLLGFSELAPEEQRKGQPRLAYFKVNDDQYIEVSPTLSLPSEDRLIHIAFQTTDARALRQYLATQNVPVPNTLRPDSEGNLSFAVTVPDGHTIEFVQYLPGSLQRRARGKFLGPRRTSRRMIHAGITVRDRVGADRFYRDILGFREMWQGGRTDQETDWIDMRVPEGKDWLEYMLNVHSPSPRQLGVMHHLALGVESVKAVYSVVRSRGARPGESHIGRDGKWQLNLYDPDFTRVEFMEFKPVRTPCCSPMRTPDN